MANRAQKAATFYSKLAGDPRFQTETPADVARLLRQPYHKVYGIITSMGIETPKTLLEVLRIHARCLSAGGSARPVGDLAEVYGRSTTLGELADLELYVLEVLGEG